MKKFFLYLSLILPYSIYAMEGLNEFTGYFTFNNEEEPLPRIPSPEINIFNVDESIFALLNNNQEQDKSIFKCTKCTREFEKKSSLVKHNWVHLSAEEKYIRKRLKCIFCTSRYSSLYGLHAHYRKEHLYCKRCVKVFSSLDLLKDHMLKLHKQNKFGVVKKK